MLLLYLINLIILIIIFIKYNNQKYNSLFIFFIVNIIKDDYIYNQDKNIYM